MTFKQNGRILTLVCPELPATYDVYKDRYSTQIAPVGTHTKKEYEWKEKFYEDFFVFIDNHVNNAEENKHREEDDS